jgi:hypothetical protein
LTARSAQFIMGDIHQFEGTGMNRSIMQPVGLRGVNLRNDVVTVQELLNLVKPAEGGANPQLKVDGVAGPRTRNAIQTFQLKYFGWKLADARVDPGGTTLKKLNEKAASAAITNSFMLYQGKKQGPFRRDRPGDWFFLIAQIGAIHPFPSAIFWFGQKGKAAPLAPAPSQLHGGPTNVFYASRPCLLFELAGAGVVRRFRSKLHKDVDFMGFDSHLSNPVRFHFTLRGGLDPTETTPGLIEYEIADSYVAEYHAELQRVS